MIYMGFGLIEINPWTSVVRGDLPLHQESRAHINVYTSWMPFTIDLIETFFIPFLKLIVFFLIYLPPAHKNISLNYYENSIIIQSLGIKTAPQQIQLIGQKYTSRDKIDL